MFALGVLGAGMVAAIVASLALAWGLGEIAGFRRSLEMRPVQAPWATASTPPVSRVALWPDLVALNIGVQVMNALLLPPMLGFLVAPTTGALPDPVRLRGAYLWPVCLVAFVPCALGVFAASAEPWPADAAR